MTALEAYGATTSASFLSGAVHGFTGEFEWSALGTGSKLGAAEKAGLAIGVIRSHTSITKLGGMISNVATGAVTGAATRQVTSWFAKGTARAAAQETTAKTVQKTTKVAVQKGVASQVECQNINSLAKLGIKDGMKIPTSQALEKGHAFLGNGYKEVVSGKGRYVSKDGTRAFRMGMSDIMGLHGGGPHVNFETLIPNPVKQGKMMVDKNYHVYLID